MNKKTFQHRLRACSRGGNLTVADLGRWFARPYQTVRSWHDRGIEPGGGPIDKDHAESMLKLLETMIRKRQGFPLPRLAPSARAGHLMKIRSAVMEARA